MVAMVSACGTKQPATELKPPEPVLADARTCPGALPGENMQITTAIGESNAPVIRWIGDAFDVAWWDLRGRFPTVRIVRVDQSGILRSPARKMPGQGVSRDHDIAWDGGETNLVWADDGRIVAVRLPGDGFVQVAHEP